MKADKDYVRKPWQTNPNPGLWSYEDPPYKARFGSASSAAVLTPPQPPVDEGARRKGQRDAQVRKEEYQRKLNEYRQRAQCEGHKRFCGLRSHTAHSQLFPAHSQRPRSAHSELKSYEEMEKEEKIRRRQMKVEEAKLRQQMKLEDALRKQVPPGEMPMRAISSRDWLHHRKLQSATTL